MGRLDHVAKTILLALACLALVAVITVWILKLWTDTLSNVASLQNEVSFITVLCFGAVVVCIISLIWIQKLGLVRAGFAALVAAFISVVCLGGLAIAGTRQGDATIVPENLPYEFLAHHDPLQYTTWATPVTSAGVETWRIAEFGFPEPFLFVCNGMSAAGQYVMLDKFRLALDWLFAFDVSMLVVMATLIFMARRPQAPK